MASAFETKINPSPFSLQSLEDYEAAKEEKAFMRSIVGGLNDLDNNRQVDLDTAKKRLGL